MKDKKPGMDTCSPINISVIVPVYNASQYLHDCIDSILAVDRQDMELLIVNDGSTDNSGIICDEYANKDKRIKVFHKPNGGVSSARNVGIDKARGKWITFVDADDKATEALLNFIPDEDVDLVCFNWEYTTGEHEKEMLSDYLLKGVNLKHFLEHHLVDFIFRTPWSKLLKREIIENHDLRFDERFSLGEDNLFVIEYLCVIKNIMTKSDIGYSYTRPATSKYGKKIDECIEYLNSYIPAYKRLEIKCPQLMFLKDLYYFEMVQKSSNINRWHWESYSVVWDMQKERLCMLPLGDRIKVIIRHIVITIKLIFNAK